MNILGKRLKQLREKHSYSQMRVAESLGISNTQLSRYESGDRNPDPELIAKFADFYGVTADYLLGRTNNPDGKSKIIKYEKTYDPILAINELVEKYGAKDFGFLDFEKWKNFTKEDVEELERHFEWVAHKAKERKDDQ